MAFPPAIAIASRNPHKLRELGRICADWPVAWVTVETHDPAAFPEVEETGATYLENALLKARAVDVDDAPDAQRSDLALLFSLVGDPDLLVAELRGSERSWIARRREMDDLAAACWLGLTPQQAQSGLAALRAIAGW